MVVTAEQYGVETMTAWVGRREIPHVTAISTEVRFDTGEIGIRHYATNPDGSIRMKEGRPVRLVTVVRGHRSIPYEVNGKRMEATR